MNSFLDKMSDGLCAGENQIPNAVLSRGLDAAGGARYAHSTQKWLEQKEEKKGRLIVPCPESLDSC